MLSTATCSTHRGYSCGIDARGSFDLLSIEEANVILFHLGNRMTEETDRLHSDGRFPSASQKTNEQWLEEGKGLTFSAPVWYEEALAAYEPAIRLDPIDELAYRLKGFAL